MPRAQVIEMFKKMKVDQAQIEILKPLAQDPNVLQVLVSNGATGELRAFKCGLNEQAVTAIKSLPPHVVQMQKVWWKPTLMQMVEAGKPRLNT